MANGIQNLDPSLWQRIKRMMNPLDDEGQMKTGDMDLSVDDAKLVAELGLDFTPGVGDVKAAFYDAPKSFRKGDTAAGILALASAIPFFGLPADVLRAIRRGTAYTLPSERLVSPKYVKRAIEEATEGGSRHLYNEQSLGYAMRFLRDAPEIGVDMEPEAFLKFARELQNPNPESLKSIRDAIKLQKPLDDIPFLNIARRPGERIADVVGHEGRHRAIVHRDLGHKTFPVRFRAARFEIPTSKSQGIRFGRQDLDYNFKPKDEFNYVDPWPTKLVKEDGEKVYDFPIPREGYNMLAGLRKGIRQLEKNYDEDLTRFRELNKQRTHKVKE